MTDCLLKAPSMGQTIWLTFLPVSLMNNWVLTPSSQSEASKSMALCLFPTVLLFSTPGVSVEGQEHREGRTSPSCAEASLRYVRSPSLRTPLVSSGVLTWIRAATDKTPDPAQCTYGVVAARPLPMARNLQPRTYRNRCCYYARRVRASLALHGLLGWRC